MSEFSKGTSFLKVVDGHVFAAVHESIRRSFPEVLVASGMMLGGSDSHHYHVITENIFGFQPMRLTPEDLEGIHGLNERIGVQAFEKMIVFYATLLQTAAG